MFFCLLGNCCEGPGGIIGNRVSPLKWGYWVLGVGVLFPIYFGVGWVTHHPGGGEEVFIAQATGWLRRIKE